MSHVIVITGQLGFLFDGETLYVRAVSTAIGRTMGLGSWDRMKAQRAANQRRRTVRRRAA